MRPRHRARQLVNLVNLSTPAGCAVAWAGAARLRRGRNGLIVGSGYDLPVPAAPAFTIGNVVLLRREVPPGTDPIGSIPVPLLEHEERHASQYAVLGGVLMPILYLCAAGWSWLRTGDFFSRNIFERGAGLASGGYRERPIRPLRESVAATVRRIADSERPPGEAGRPVV